MGYLSNYLYYTKGSECPESFWRWSAISLASHIMGPKVWFMHGFIPINPALYTCLIGSAGSGKSTARGEVFKRMKKQFSEMLISANVQSREDIIDLMIDDLGRTWKGPAGPEGEVSVKTFCPFYIVANEFESLLSVNPVFMIQFLTDIFDNGFYSKGFKKDRVPGKKNEIESPYVSMLALGVPEWFMRELKMTMFSGGLGRRMILVVDEPNIAVHRPYRPSDSSHYEGLVEEHLDYLFYLNGEIGETELAAKWWKEWYYPHKKAKPDDPLLAQFHSTKHVMVMKLAMILCTDSMPAKPIITDEHYMVALAMLDALAPKIEKLTRGVGRNVVAGFMSELITTIEEAGGMINRMRLRLLTYRNAPNGVKGFEEAMKELIETKQIHILVDEKPDERGYIHQHVLLPKNYEEWKKNKEAGK